MRLKILFIALFISTLSYGPSANAVEMGIEAGLEFPVQIGGRFRMDFNQSFYMSAGLGYSAGFLTDMMADMSSGLGVVGDNTATLMSDAIRDSLYIDIRGGFQMENGLFFEGGLSTFQAGGGDTDECTLINAYNQPLETGLCGQGFFLFPGNSYTVDANVINLTFHGGYTVEIGSFELKLEGGIIKPISAEANVDTVFVTSLEEANLGTLEGYLEDSFTNDLWIISLGASALFRF